MQRRLRLPAFTLLELLVVISIIGILAAIGFGSFSQAQKQGRDAKRRSDFKTVQNTLEQYYSVNTKYDGSGCAGTAASLTVNGTTVSDPAGQVTYSCTVTGTGSSSTYCACAKLDSLTAGNASGSDCSGSSGQYYCVKNLQ